MAAIFISYRKTRDGKESTSDAAHAEYLAGDLRDAFGHDSVFLDDQEPFIGRFDDFLNNELGRCQAVVVVIGQAWLERSKDFLNAEDWVRHEIEFGLKQKRTMVPVFFDNVTINDAKKALKPAADWGLVPPALPQKNALSGSLGVPLPGTAAAEYPQISGRLGLHRPGTAAMG